jgi:hypothetical protein
LICIRSNLFYYSGDFGLAKHLEGSAAQGKTFAGTLFSLFGSISSPFFSSFVSKGIHESGDDRKPTVCYQFFYLVSLYPFTTHFFVDPGTISRRTFSHWVQLSVSCSRVELLGS